MSTTLSLREVLERRVVTPASVLAGSASRTIKLLLTAEAFDRPVDVARLLWRHGLSLKRAHMALDRLAERKLVPVELVTDNPDSTIAELAALQVFATIIETPEVDVKGIRQREGLSQSEFATLYGIDEDTLKNWEQGRNRPDGPAKVLLAVIASCPSAVVQARTAPRADEGPPSCRGTPFGDNSD
jgi:DNA-binding transcriptional regulator YiaG